MLTSIEDAKAFSKQENVKRRSEGVAECFGPHARHEPMTGKVFGGTNLRKDWMTACHSCGLGTKIEVEGKKHDPRYEYLTLHELRRSAVRNLINAGVRARVAMQITGHRTRSVFDRCHIVSPVDVIDAMQAVETASLRKPPASVKQLKKSPAALSSNG